jgi:integrase
MVAWKDALVAAGKTAKAIKGGQLAAARALFRYALENDLVSANPAEGVTIRAKKQAGQSKQPYENEEVATLLSLAKLETLPYRRWLPWLMALSGARVAEVAQLWGRRVVQVQGTWVMKIAPAEDGGSLKNAGSERDVPIHPAIIELGFLAFVKERGEGPLFYGAAKGTKRGRRGRGEDDTEGKRHASKGVSNHLAA